LLAASTAVAEGGRQEPALRAWLAGRHGEIAAREARLLHAAPAGRGARVYQFEHRRHELPIFNAWSRLLQRPDGGVTVLEDVPPFAPPARAPVFRSSPGEAIQRAAEAVGADRVPPLADAHPRAVLHQENRPRLVPGWQVQIPVPSRGEHWHVLVDDASGEVVWSLDWARQCQIATTPLPARSVEEMPPSPMPCFPDPSASPHGWFDLDGLPGEDSTVTFGVNVSVQEDNDANDGGGQRPDGGGQRSLVFPFDPSLPPTRNFAASAAHSFALHNHLHDLWYHLGFGPADGNYQLVNRGEGGLAGDPVQVDILDGGGSNNAVAVAPADGQPGRLNFYLFTRPRQVELRSPSHASSPLTGVGATFGGAFPPEGLAGVLAAARDAADGLGPSTNDACSAILNPDDLVGRIALVDRGTCTFLHKVKACQAAGAIGVVVANHVEGTLSVMTGTDDTVVIPVVQISRTDGQLLRGLLAGTEPVEIALFGEPFRDGSLDHTLAIHEHAHLLTQRLAGGPANANCLFQLQGGGLAEGYSDWFALALTARPGDTPEQDRLIGAYSNGNAALGFRRFPYTTATNRNSLTYADLNGLVQRHQMGEIWCTALWEFFWEMVAQQGFSPDWIHGDGGNRRALQLVIASVKLMPCNPTYVDARNALLEADRLLYDGDHACAIWRAFARRGLGVNATDLGGAASNQVQADFQTPPGCSAAAPRWLAVGTGASGALQVRWQAESGAVYRVQRPAGGGGWQDVLPPVTASAATVEAELPTEEVSDRLRVRRESVPVP
jgi:hypothetical protein